MASLSQLLAERKSANPVYKRKTEDILKQVQNTVALDGIRKVYNPIVESDPDIIPNENKPVAARIPEIFNKLITASNDMFELDLTVDMANMNNKATVIVDGQTFLKDVPTLFLLQLGKRVDDLITIVTKTTVLDNAKTWIFDKDNNCYITEPAKTIRTKNVAKAVTKAAATDKFAAQVEMITGPEVVGHFTTTNQSGAITPAAKAEVLDRLTKIKSGIASAVASANSNMKSIEYQKVSDTMLKWAFTPAMGND